MPDSLNKHVSQKSMTLDPTLQDSIEDAALRWIGTADTWIPVDVAKLAFRAGVEAAPGLLGIGPITYDLICCIRANFEQAFPGETMRDPQDAIQRMSAELIQWRRALQGIE